jgi:RNA polymerase sigma factor (sigma-70 family)
MPEVDAANTGPWYLLDREVQTENIDIDRALATLPRDDRLALFLYFYLDLPLDEVGTVLGLNAAAAKTRVYRATKKLRPRLEMD